VGIVVGGGIGIGIEMMALVIDVVINTMSVCVVG